MKPRIWKTYDGARRYGCRVMRAKCEGCAAERFAITREVDPAMAEGKMTLLCQACMACIVSWKDFEPPTGRKRATVERVYETRIDFSPARLAAA